MQGRQLWPTWTSLPSGQRVVDAIEVKVRVAGPGRLSQNRFYGGNGGPAPWVWWFYSVLEHFLIEGIASPEVCNTRGAARGNIPRMAVRVLDLDIIDPLVPIERRTARTTAEEPSVQPCSRHYPGLICRRCRLPKLLTPERVFYGLVHEIHQLLGMSSTTHFYGELLYTGIETIRFRLRGELKEEVDLGDWLRQWPLQYENRNMAAWLERTTKVRQTLGLATPVGGSRKTDSHRWRLHTVFDTAHRACAGLLDYEK